MHQEGAGAFFERTALHRHRRGLPCPQARRARAFERKRRRPLWVEELERRSPLQFFFTGGIEYDGRIDPGRLAVFIEDFQRFVRRLGISPLWGRSVELKFRRLGRHRADGLYYPDCRVLVMDLRSARSFAHELGHLVDFHAHPGPVPGSRAPAASSRSEFLPFHDLMISRMLQEGQGDPRLSRGRGRCSWSYFTSRQECFARAFEQWAAERLGEPSSLLGAPERYRSDVLFFREVPGGLGRYFETLVARGPAGLTSPASRTRP